MLRQRIAKDMEHKILCGKWSLHSAIPAESQLCSEYHVSKTTIRSALQDLESKGFIKIAQGKRAVVISRNGTSLALIPPQTVYSKEYILSALESRMIFERGIAGIAAERITDEEIAELQACYDEMLSTTCNCRSQISYAFGKIYKESAHSHTAKCDGRLYAAAYEKHREHFRSGTRHQAP